MAKSLRSHWKKKMRAEKRKKIEPKVLARLQKTVANVHIPTIVAVEAAEREKEKIAAKLAASTEMDATGDDKTKAWMNQRRLKRMKEGQKGRGNKLIDDNPKHQPRLRSAFKKRQKGKHRKLNKRMNRLSKFPVS